MSDKAPEVGPGPTTTMTHLDRIHDAVGENSHLARDSLDSLFELSDVRSGGEHAVETRRPP